jgi:hypothetical protein
MLQKGFSLSIFVASDSLNIFNFVQTKTNLVNRIQLNLKFDFMATLGCVGRGFRIMKALNLQVRSNYPRNSPITTVRKGVVNIRSVVKWYAMERLSACVVRSCVWGL